jgi:hypothetical protein
MIIIREGLQRVTKRPSAGEYGWKVADRPNAVIEGVQMVAA